MTTLRKRREALGLTQAQLAQELGIDRKTLNRQEQRPEIARLYDLALEALEIRRGRRPAPYVQPAIR